jgi:hypothetical protein
MIQGVVNIDKNSHIGIKITIKCNNSDFILGWASKFIQPQL